VIGAASAAPCRCLELFSYCADYAAVMRRSTHFRPTATVEPEADSAAGRRSRSGEQQ